MERYQCFNIPEQCFVGSSVFKKLFYENSNLTVSDRELLTIVVNKITWIYSLKPETISVKPFKDDAREYLEIEFLEVIISKDKKVKRIAEIIMRAIPYPMVIIFKLDEKMQLWTAHQRINQNDKSQNTFEELINTSWLSSEDSLFNNLDIRKMRLTNYYTLYSDIVDAISIYNAECITGRKAKLSGDKARELLEKVNSIDGEIQVLRAALKKETQFNRKIEMNIKIKGLSAEREKLTQLMVGDK